MDRSEYKLNLDSRAAGRARMRCAAERFLAGQVGAIETARELRSYWDIVEPEIRDCLLVFVAIDSETDALPLGEVRQHWNPAALVTEDKKIADAERNCHGPATDAANFLLQWLRNTTVE